MRSVGCGIFLIIFAVVALLVLVVVPLLPGMSDNPVVLNIAASILCQPNETAEIEVVVTTDSDGTGYTPHVTCIGREGERTEQTGKLFLIVGVIFTVPLLLGILVLNLRGMRREVREVVGVGQDMMSVLRQASKGNPAAGSPSSIDAGLSSDFWQGAREQSNTGNLVAKLKELEAARDSGLITQAEYDQLRKEVLDKLA
jgi:hypothetical protein